MAQYLRDRATSGLPDPLLELAADTIERLREVSRSYLQTIEAQRAELCSQRVHIARLTEIVESCRCDGSRTAGSVGSSGKDR
jgi:hypothetical protein